MAEASLDPNDNKWDLVFDFTSEDADGNKLNNSKLLDPSEFSIVTKEVEGFDEPASQIPVPQKYGGTLTDNDLEAHQKHDGMMEFGFGTSATEAQEQFDQAEAPETLTAEEPVVTTEGQPGFE